MQRLEEEQRKLKQKADEELVKVFIKIIGERVGKEKQRVTSENNSI